MDSLAGEDSSARREVSNKRAATYTGDRTLTSRQKDYFFENIEKELEEAVKKLPTVRPLCLEQMDPEVSQYLKLQSFSCQFKSLAPLSNKAALVGSIPQAERLLAEKIMKVDK